MEYDITYKAEIITGDAIVDPEGCISISFENLGASNVYIMDNVIVSPSKIREFINEPYCSITQKFRVSYRGTYDPASRNLEQLLVVKTFATLKK